MSLEFRKIKNIDSSKLIPRITMGKEYAPQDFKETIPITKIVRAKKATSLSILPPLCHLSTSAKAPNPIKSVAHQEACTTMTSFTCCNCNATNSAVSWPDCGFCQHKSSQKCKWIFNPDDIGYDFPLCTFVGFMEVQRY